VFSAPSGLGQWSMMAGRPTISSGRPRHQQCVTHLLSRSKATFDFAIICCGIATKSLPSLISRRLKRRTGRPNRLTLLHTYDNDSTDIVKFSYTYDTSGNPLTMAYDHRRHGTFKSYEDQFDYDNLSRLTDAQHFDHFSTDNTSQPLYSDRVHDEQFTYDTPGNRLTLDYVDNDNNSDQVDYECNIVNELTSRESLELEYDAAGNLTKDNSTRVTDDDNYTYCYIYEWDFENRLTAVKRLYDNSSTVDIADFAYDGLGRRIEKIDHINNTTLRYYYSDKHQVLAEYDGAGDEQRYFVYGNFTAHWVWAVPDDFASAFGNPYGFTGRRIDRLDGKDDTDGVILNYHRARYLNPATGRWLSRDPIGYVDGMNLYQYADNSPSKLADPLGTSVLSCLNDVFFSSAPPLFEYCVASVQCCRIYLDPRNPCCWAAAGCGAAAAGCIMKNRTPVYDYVEVGISCWWAGGG